MYSLKTAIFQIAKLSPSEPIAANFDIGLPPQRQGLARQSAIHTDSVISIDDEFLCVDKSAHRLEFSSALSSNL